MVQAKISIHNVFTISMFVFGFISSSMVFAQTAPPTPVGLTPNSRQVEWYHREQQAFIHFNMNTFTNSEWGSGTESPNLFNPTHLDCGQWMRAFKATGITTAILVIKHHDGFCLWPSAFTNHSVKYSSWRSGKGDVLREFTDSCHAYGIKAAIYLSPWDRHESQPGAAHPFGTPAYVDYYCNQIVELCKNKPYGPLYEIWQDGAGDISSIKPSDYRKWTDTLHRYMPECIVWSTKASDSCGDVRWVCTEGGVAGDPCWSTVNLIDVYKETGMYGSPTGDTYMPAETNTSIYSDGAWFWSTNGHPLRSVTNLWDLYFTSVARNTVLLLNFPPDNRGMIPTADSTNGAGMGSYIYGTFCNNLLNGATATALHSRGTGFEPANMLDSCESTYFATADGNNTDTIVFTPKSAITFDCIMLQEVIGLGVRTLNWSVDAYSNNTWTTITAANNKQCIGFKRAVKWSPATTATQVRLRITAGKACPAIHTFGVYKQTQVKPPNNWNGLGPVVPCSTSTAVLPPEQKASTRVKSNLQIAGNQILLPAGFSMGQITVNIIDVKGRCVQKLVTAGNNTKQRLKLSYLKPGSYLVRCNNGTQTLETKFTSLH